MGRPLPPSLHGPLYPQSTRVFLEPVLDGAKVTVLVEGLPAFEGVRPIDGWIEVGATLHVGQKVSAIQSVGAESSLASIHPVMVEPTPTRLPAPEFVSVINNHSSVIAVRGLVVGARLEVVNDQSGAVLADLVVARHFEYVRLDLSVSLEGARTLSARQTLGDLASPTRWSPALNDIDGLLKSRKLPPPQALVPLTACRTDLTLWGIPGLELSVHNEGFVTSFLVGGFPLFAVTDCQPLQTGTLVVLQSVDRLKLTSESPVYEVGDPVPPGKPQIAAPYCPGTQVITALGLDPGADITVLAFDPSASRWLEIGRDKSGGARKDVALPIEMLRAAGIPVDRALQLRLVQSRCGVAGEASEPVGTGPYGPRAAPVIRGPVIDCSPFVILDATTPGSQIMLFDRHKQPLCAVPYHPIAGFNIVTLTRPVEAGETIFGTCRFCDVTVDIREVGVEAVEGALATELGPIKPQDSFLHFSKCLVGSRIDITKVDAHSKQAVFLTHSYPLTRDWDVNVVDGAALDDTFLFVVSVCDRFVAKGQVRCEQGRLAVRVAPSSIPAGTTTHVVVHVTDAAYGRPVSSDLYPEDGGALVNAGNQPMAWRTPTGRTAPYRGVVRSPNYADAPYEIAVHGGQRPNPGPADESPAVDAALRLTSDGNVYEGMFELTVRGKGFPAGTPARLEIEYAALEENSGSIRKETRTLAEFDVDPDGGFTETRDFALTLRHPWTGTPLNLGVTAVVETGPALYDARFTLPMPQNHEGEMQRER